MATSGPLWIFTLVIFSFAVPSFSVKSSRYTDNAVCRQNMCVNPFSPGLDDLASLETILWECSNESTVKPFVDFCQAVIHYDVALPSPNGAGQGIDKLAKSQDDAAATTFFYHLSALGYEAGEHATPSNSSDPCVQSVWKLACYTYFPKAQAGCKLGETTPYYRPCKDTCGHYLQACNVECCDESLQCVFAESKKNRGGNVNVSGYVDANGPSAICTGQVFKSATPCMRSNLMLILMLFGLQSAFQSDEKQIRAPRTPSGQWAAQRVILTVALLMAAISLQAFQVEQAPDIEHHAIGNWQQQPNYLARFAVTVQDGNGTGPARSALNSCSIPGVLKCSGHGVCKVWSRQARVHDLHAQANSLSFCQCEPQWVDPECRTARKSQLKAFLLSLFAGFLGADYFYLGYPVTATVKLLSLGGLGFWWLLDVVRTGAGPVYTAEFRTAPDLPHFVFVMVTVTIFLIIGFFISIESYLSYRRSKREELMSLQHSEETRRLQKMEDIEGPRFQLPARKTGFESSRSFAGYGSTLPMPLPNAGAPMVSSGRPPF